MKHEYVTSVDDLMDDVQHRILEIFHHSTDEWDEKAIRISGLICWTAGYAMAKNWDISPNWIVSMMGIIKKCRKN